jgi:hypothetical protein
MQQQFEKRKLTLNKKTIVRLNSLGRHVKMLGGATFSCDCPPTWNCTDNTCDTTTRNTCETKPTLTPASKCIGQTSAPITHC